MNPLENYFRELREIRATGTNVPETSYYGALEMLLNEVGRTMKPKVRCVINIANRGAGIPDGGLFTENQFQRLDTGKPIQGQLPERGVVEIKPTNEDAWITAAGEQVSRYWEMYGLVLVTNYRDFVLIGKDSRGQSQKLETYRLSNDESSFWAMVANPQSIAKLHFTSFIEYLKRVLLHATPITAPEDVAWFLASYARDSKARIEKTQLPTLTTLRASLEEELGLEFVDEKGEHFFRSTLIQTLFYGMFSAWVLWSKDQSDSDRSTKFDWRTTAWSLRVPMIRALFEQIATTRLESIGLVEPMDWAAAVLNRVDRSKFFAIFDEGKAVQYFYEPFLKQFDPELRKDLGVWFTPPEIVKYMVARVDQVLRQELEIPDGLADHRVIILDPCCGTGAYLTEAIRYIADAIREKYGDALAPLEIKKAVMERIFGFEILPAPFVVAHLQMGLLLQHLQAPLSQDKSERAPIYLTNSLTGWSPVKEAQQQLLYPELEQERKTADGIKQVKPILVILGNPPYNAFAGVSSTEENGVVDLYKKGLNKPVSEDGWGIKKFNLDDLYIRFFRIAERKIVESKPGYGIICFITNFSFLRKNSYVVMRQHFFNEFDNIWLDCMNGDSRETGKLTPEGLPDPSVFSTQYHPVGIKLGTVISLLVRKPQRKENKRILYRDLWGVKKREDLLKSLEVKKFNDQYTQIKSSKQNRYLFKPTIQNKKYETWPRLLDLCKEPPINGLMEKRGSSLIDIDLFKLEERMKSYFDPKIDWETLRIQGGGLTKDAAGFKAETARQKILALEQFNSEKIVSFALRPFDNRWCYYSGTNPLWNRPRPTLWKQYLKKNLFLMSRPSGVASREGVPFFFTSRLGDNDFLRGHAYYFPLKLYVEKINTKLFPDDSSVADWEPNLSHQAWTYLIGLGIPDSQVTEFAECIWLHALAIGFSPKYLSENTEGIKIDWPRIPLPRSKDLLLASSKLGKMLAQLLDSDSLEGITSGKIRKELSLIGSLAKGDGTAINLEKGDLQLTTEWGHIGQDGIIMPGIGKVVIRDYSSEELAHLSDGVASLGIGIDEILKLIGIKTVDVYLNDNVYWRCIPERVWNTTIGGYQVIKKWLSYRQRQILSRDLNIEEAREVTNIARRLTAIVLTYPFLDENYGLSKGKD